MAPHATNNIAELDAALLIGMTEDEYAVDCAERTAVTEGFDFRHNRIRYQVKANRPSGGNGSRVTLVSAAKNYDWERLIWILYDPAYQVAEAWLWEREDYEARFANARRLSPDDMKIGRPLWSPRPAVLSQ